MVTDTSNWSSAAFGSCSSIVKSQIVAKACSSAASAESSLFIDGAKFGNHFGFRVLRHHITLLDRYWRQIPIQVRSRKRKFDVFLKMFSVYRRPTILLLKTLGTVCTLALATRFCLCAQPFSSKLPLPPGNTLSCAAPLCLERILNCHTATA